MDAPEEAPYNLLRGLCSHHLRAKCESGATSLDGETSALLRGASPEPRSGDRSLEGSIPVALIPAGLRHPAQLSAARGSTTHAGVLLTASVQRSSKAKGPRGSTRTKPIRMAQGAAVGAAARRRHVPVQRGSTRQIR
jgi:hypothetical protein